MNDEAVAAKGLWRARGGRAAVEGRTVGRVAAAVEGRPWKGRLWKEAAAVEASGGCGELAVESARSEQARHVDEPHERAVHCGRRCRSTELWVSDG